MAHPRQAIDQLRTVLERKLSSTDTSAVLFEALSAWQGPVPTTEEELRMLLQGPLTETLICRVGGAETKGIVQQIHDALGRFAQLEQDRDGDSQEFAIDVTVQTEPELDPETTQAVPIARDPVEVAVIASTEHFAHRLLAVLGPRRIHSCPVRSPKQLLALTPLPALVVVDSQDFPTAEPSAIAEAMAKFPKTTHTLLWSAHLPYGRMISACFKGASLSLVPLTLEHGIAPMLDLIRSRYRGAV